MKHWLSLPVEKAASKSVKTRLTKAPKSLSLFVYVFEAIFNDDDDDDKHLKCCCCVNLPVQSTMITLEKLDKQK